MDMLTGKGFLTPYRGVRYHLKEWDRGGPQNARELFNLRHAAARNVIERSFGLLKMRWGILQSPSYYSIDVQSRIVVACCLCTTMYEWRCRMTRWNVKY
ncbi:UNVERIFIED_CONTAM: hypothetical protein Slati_1357700 [Sesamum latifolium]|uniref:DDE Tnp4 domain-containing protein n=1 Tax=Sesamum latifolium TaxID=2727402 RepID=A0AAW2XM72_9LAMI